MLIYTAFFILNMWKAASKAGSKQCPQEYYHLPG